MVAKFKIYHSIFFRILLIILGIGGVFYLLKKSLVYTSVFIGFIVLLFIIELYFYLKNVFLFYDKTISAILNKDFSADFSKHKSFQNYKKLFELYDTLKQNEKEHLSKDLIYSSILNNIETGILLLQKQEKEWSIFLMNDFFSKHFEVPKVSK